MIERRSQFIIKACLVSQWICALILFFCHFLVYVISPIFKEIFYMEKRQFQSIDQCKGVCLENFIDWSIAFSKDDVSSDEEDFVEPVSKCCWWEEKAVGG